MSHLPSWFVCFRKFVPYVSYALSCLTYLRALRAFVPYVPSCLTRLRTLRVLLTRLIYAPYASFSRFLHALFMRLKMFLGWICTSAETFHFPRIINGTTNRAVFMWVKKQLWNFLSGELFKAYLKREISSVFLCFSFHLFKHEVINFLVRNNKKSKWKKSYLIFDITAMYCKYATESLSNLRKIHSFYCQSKSYS